MNSPKQLIFTSFPKSFLEKFMQVERSEIALTYLNKYISQFRQVKIVNYLKRWLVAPKVQHYDEVPN